jgi:gas vesicle protein
MHRTPPARPANSSVLTISRAYVKEACATDEELLNKCEAVITKAAAQIERVHEEWDIGPVEVAKQLGVRIIGSRRFWEQLGDWSKASDRPDDGADVLRLVHEERLDRGRDADVEPKDVNAAATRLTQNAKLTAKRKARRRSMSPFKSPYSKRVKRKTACLPCWRHHRQCNNTQPCKSCETHKTPDDCKPQERFGDGQRSRSTVSEGSIEVEQARGWQVKVLSEDSEDGLSIAVDLESDDNDDDDDDDATHSGEDCNALAIEELLSTPSPSVDTPHTTDLIDDSHASVSSLIATHPSPPAPPDYYTTDGAHDDRDGPEDYLAVQYRQLDAGEELGSNIVERMIEVISPGGVRLYIPGNINGLKDLEQWSQTHSSRAIAIEKDAIIVPVNVPLQDDPDAAQRKGHWVLFGFLRDSRRVKIMDSANCRDLPLEDIARSLTRVFAPHDWLEPERTKVQQQTNDKDCGLHVIWSSYLIALGREVFIHELNTALFRYIIQGFLKPDKRSAIRAWLEGQTRRRVSAAEPEPHYGPFQTAELYATTQKLDDFKWQSKRAKQVMADISYFDGIFSGLISIASTHIENVERDAETASLTITRAEAYKALAHSLSGDKMKIDTRVLTACNEEIASANRMQEHSRRAKQKAEKSQRDATGLRDVNTELKQVLQELQDDVEKEIDALKQTVRDFGRDMRKAADDLDQYLDRA